MRGQDNTENNKKVHKQTDFKMKSNGCRDVQHTGLQSTPTRRNTGKQGAQTRRHTRRARSSLSSLYKGSARSLLMCEGSVRHHCSHYFCTIDGETYTDRYLLEQVGNHPHSVFVSSMGSCRMCCYLIQSMYVVILYT